MVSGIFSVAARMKHIFTPATPPDGESLLYFKPDGLPYCKDPAGTERPLIEVPVSLHNNASFDEVTSTDGANLMSGNDATFDTGIGSWVQPGALAGSTITSDTTHIAAGPASGKMHWVSGDGGLKQVQVTGMVVGTTYRISCLAWVSPGASVPVKIGIFEAGVPSGDPSTVQGDWAVLTAFYTATTSTRPVYIIPHGTPTADLDVWVDSWVVQSVGIQRAVDWSSFWMTATDYNGYAADPDVKVSGYSARVTARNGGNNRLQTQDAFAVTDTQTINIAFWARTDCVAPVPTIHLNFLTGTVPSEAQYFSAAAHFQNASFTPTTEWKRYSAVFPVPPGKLFARFDFLSSYPATPVHADCNVWYDETVSTAVETGGSTDLAVEVDNYQSSSAQAITASTFTKVTGWSQVGTDPQYVTFASDQWTVISSGTFLLDTTVEFAAAASARRIVMIVVNGSDVTRSETTTANINSTQCMWVGELVTGDVVQVQVWSSGAVSLSGSAPPHTMQITPIKGPKGDPGSDGTDGLPGSKWYNESPATPVPPTTSVFAGDMFLYDNGDVYAYDGSAWVLTANTKGPAGTTFATSNEGTVIQSDTRTYNFVGDQVDATTGPGLNDVTVTIQSVLPTGTVVPWPTATPPAGWILCNGATIPNTTFPALAAVLRTESVWVVDASNFRVPDMRNFFPVGVGGTKVLGVTGGSETKPVPTHTHTTPNHTHTDNFVNAAAGHVGNTNTATGGTADRIGSIAGGGPGGSHTHGISGGVTSSGAGTTGAASGSAFDIQPPYMPLNYIIKT